MVIKMLILNNNLPKDAFRILGKVQGQQSGTLKQAHDGSKAQMEEQAKQIGADAVLGLRYSQRPNQKTHQVIGNIHGIAIKITNRKYINELFRGVC